jgi:hypothetical protein
VSAAMALYPKKFVDSLKPLKDSTRQLLGEMQTINEVSQARIARPLPCTCQ